MKKKQRELLKEMAAHIFAWALYFIYENAAVFLIYPKRVFLVSSCFYFLLNAIFFYGNYQLILIVGVDKFKYLKRIIIVVCLCIIYLNTNYALMILIRDISLPTSMFTASIREFTILRIFRFLYIISISYTYWLIKDKLKMERNLLSAEKSRYLEIQKTAEMEKEKIKSELNYLRLQINPHFLFNTLSLIYTEVIKYSEKASESIMLLSNILRNILANPDSDGKVWLKDEIEHITNLIKIHQLRFDKKMSIQLSIPEDELSADKKIIPFILITLVENAFKHGDLLDKQHATVIDLSIKDEQLFFTLHNKKKSNNLLRPGFGIGLKNIEQRLGLAYSNKHSLKIIDNTNFYSVILRIPLNHDELYNN